MINYCTGQLFIENQWHDAATVTLTGDEQQGWKAATHSGYTLDHVLGFQGHRDAHACTVRCAGEHGATPTR